MNDFYLYVNPYMLISNKKEELKKIVMKKYHINDENDINIFEFDVSKIPEEILPSFNADGVNVITGISYQQYVQAVKEQKKLNINVMSGGIIMDTDTFVSFVEKEKNLSTKMFYLDISYDKFMDFNKEDTINVSKKDYDKLNSVLREFVNITSGGTKDSSTKLH